MKNYTTISYNNELGRNNLNLILNMEEQIKQLERRLTVIELFLSLFFSIFITLLYIIVVMMGTRFVGINLIQISISFMIVFGTTLFTLNIIVPIIKIIEKVGISIKDIWNELKSYLNKKTRIEKIITGISFILGIINIIGFIFIFIK
jgi:hypothetical protein